MQGRPPAKQGCGSFSYLIALALGAVDQNTTGKTPAAALLGAQAKPAEGGAAQTAGVKAAGMQVGPAAGVLTVAALGRPGAPQPAMNLRGNLPAAGAAAVEASKDLQATSAGIRVPEGTAYSDATPKAGLIAEQAGLAKELAAAPAELGAAGQGVGPTASQMMLGANVSQAGLTDVSPKASRPVGRPGRAVEAIGASLAGAASEAPAAGARAPKQATGQAGRALMGGAVSATGRTAPTAGSAGRPGRFAGIRQAAIDINAGEATAVRVEADPSASAEGVVRTSPADVQQAQATQESQPTAGSIPDQIAAQFRADPGRASQRVVIRLNPPELGRVSVTFRETGGQLQGEMKFSNPEALAEARLETPGLIGQLADSGIRVRQLDISLEADGFQQQLDWLGREGSQQDQRQGWGDLLGEASEDLARAEEPPSDPLADPPGNQPGDGSAINLWV